jgi:hypothetical protein
MCSIEDNWLKDVNYLDVRKKDLKELTNSYIKFQDRLLELENKPINNDIKREINENNDSILKLQNKIFKNNKKNLEYIVNQKGKIDKKNKSIKINKKFLDDIKNRIDSNEGISHLRDARMTESSDKNKDVEKYYTGYFIIIVLFLVIQVILVVLLFKDGGFGSSNIGPLPDVPK